MTKAIALSNQLTSRLLINLRTLSIFLYTTIIFFIAGRFLIWLPHPKKWPGITKIALYPICVVINYFFPVNLNLKTHVVPKTKVLFVSNHTTGFGLDAICMFAALYVNHGIFPRGLADRMHFLVPGWAHALWISGVFAGVFDVADEVMKSGQNLVVFPG
jgi:1-acyl-sn-glycerol-3-phosphate acyltransferase